MDETTLTATLRSLASEPVLHTEPSADARLRARRLQHRRMAEAATAVVVVAAVVGGAVAIPRGNGQAGPGSASHDWQRDLAEPSFRHHATSQTVVVMDARSGASLGVAYWQGKHLCDATVVSGRVTTSECASVTPAATAPVTVADIGSGTVWASVRSDVREVKATTTDGKVVGLHPMGGDRFPYRVVVTTGKVVSLRAYNTAGKQLGETVAGPDALRVAQVKSVEPCAGAPSPLPAGELADRTRESCYVLQPAAMTLVARSAQALQDLTQGWLIQVSLNDHDRVSFGELTQRVTSQPAPANQLALVFGGKVQSAPTIESAITGGVLQLTGGTEQFTEQQAQQLAAQLGG